MTVVRLAVALDRPPRPPAGALRRARLLDRLQASMSGCLAAVIAPAGYGKTTLLAQFAQESSLPAAWVQLQEEDADAVWLAARVGAAVAAATPVPHEAWPDPFSLPQWLEAPSLEPFLLVLEDVHAVPGGTPGEKLIQRLLASGPASYHLVLSSRTEPAWPEFAKRKVERSVALVRASDLRFTQEEIDAVVAAGRADGAGEYDRIRSTGWPIGLTFALRGRRGPWAADESDLYSYFEQQVLGDLPPDDLRFVCLAAWLARLTPESLAALLGPADPERRLSRLAADGLVTRVSSQTGLEEFRFHDLFRDYLRRRAREVFSDELVALHLRAGRYYAESGEWLEAAHHFSSARAWDELVAVLEAGAPVLRRSGRWQTILSIAELLPAGSAARSTRVLLYKATALYYLDRFDAALGAIDDANRLSPSSDEEKVEIASLQAALLLERGAVDEAERLATAAVQTVRGLGIDGILAADCERRLAGVAVRRGRYQEAISLLTSALAVYERVGAVSDSTLVEDLLGGVLSQLGQFPGALVYLERARLTQEAAGNDRALARIHGSIGFAQYRLSNRPAALSAFVESLKYSRRANTPQLEASALMHLARYAQFSDEPATALELFEQALKVAGTTRDAWAVSSALASAGNVLRRLGRLEEGHARLAQALADAERRGAKRESGLYTVWLALHDVARGDLAVAAEKLETAVRVYREIQANGEPVASGLYLLAAVCFRRRQRKRCLALMKQVAEEIADYGPSIVDEAVREMPEAAQYAVARRQDAEAWRRALDRVSSSTHLEDKVSSVGSVTGQQVQLDCLGRLRVGLNGREVPPVAWRSTGAVELLAYLVWKSRPVRALDAAAELWPELDGSQASSRFHSNLYRIRRALYPNCVVESAKRYAVNSVDVFDLDARKFADLWRRARRTADEGSRKGLLEAAVSLHLGPLADEFFSEWATGLRREIDDDYVDALVSLADLALGSQKYAEAENYCREALALDETCAKAAAVLQRTRGRRPERDLQRT